MKKLIVTLLLTGSVAVTNAYNVPENPDRRTSIGFHFDHGWNESDYVLKTFKITDFTTSKANRLDLDVRIPLNPTFTFSLRGGFGKAVSDSFLGENVETSEKNIGFSVRAYLR